MWDMFWDKISHTTGDVQHEKWICHSERPKLGVAFWHADSADIFWDIHGIYKYAYRWTVPFDVIKHFFRLRNPKLDVTFFMEVHSSENPRTKWGIVHCHVCLMEVTVQGNSTKQSGLQHMGVAFTLWLCQNSYWKWPISSWFTYYCKNSDFP